MFTNTSNSESHESHKQPSSHHLSLVSLAILGLLSCLIAPSLNAQEHKAPSHFSNVSANPATNNANASALSSQVQNVNPNHANNTKKVSDLVTLNFNNAEIEGVARTMAVITGRNIVVDPRVKGLMTFISDSPMSPARAYKQFLALLRLQGFTVIESDGLHKVIPEAEAKLQSEVVNISQSDDNHRTKNNSTNSSNSNGSQIETQIFRMNFESANNLIPILRPLISPNNTINVNPGNNSLVVTDYADNLKRIGRIIAAMDVSNASDVEVIPLNYALAHDLAPLVMRLLDSGSTGMATGQGQTDTSYKTTILPEPRSNALILRAANPARAALARSLIARLDQPASTIDGGQNAAGNIHVVYLKNADATKLAATLRAAMSANGSNGSNNSSAGSNSAMSNPSSSSSAASNNSTSSATSTNSISTGASSNFGNSNVNMPSTGGQIQADPTTNSLIITAPEPQFRQLRAVIDQLDGRRAQVLVESLIVEVNASKLAQFGVQWQSALGNKGENAVGTNSSLFGANIFSLSAATLGSVLPSAGFNFGLGHQVNGKHVLGFLAQFLEKNTDGNVLSTPTLLTLDNEEAKIVIGQNVPFLTGSYTNTGGGSTVNPFQTVERKDVGLTLRVKPQINENGTVRLSIYQEVSSVEEASKTDRNGPTTKKRAIESNVLVEDGNIVALGGLLQEDYGRGVEKVPLLGDLPVLGHLFKSESRNRTKTNLMVFLRPTILRDATATQSLAVDRYDSLRTLQQNSQPEYSPMLKSVSDAPVLPALPGSAPAKEAAPANAPSEPNQTNHPTHSEAISKETSQPSFSNSMSLGSSGF